MEQRGNAPYYTSRDFTQIVDLSTRDEIDQLIAFCTHGKPLRKRQRTKEHSGKNPVVLWGGETEVRVCFSVDKGIGVLNVKVEGDSLGISEVVYHQIEDQCNKMRRLNEEIAAKTEHTVRVYNKELQILTEYNECNDFEVKNDELYLLKDHCIIFNDNVIELSTEYTELSLTPSPFIIYLYNPTIISLKDTRAPGEQPFINIANTKSIIHCSCCSLVTVLSHKLSLYDNRYLKDEVYNFSEIYPYQNRTSLFTAGQVCPAYPTNSVFSLSDHSFEGTYYIELHIHSIESGFIYSLLPSRFQYQHTTLHKTIANSLTPFPLISACSFMLNKRATSIQSSLNGVYISGSFQFSPLVPPQSTSAPTVNTRALLYSLVSEEVPDSPTSPILSFEEFGDFEDD